MPEQNPPPDPFSFALIGAGKVGTTVAMLLRRAGHRPVGVASRRAATAQEAGAVLGASTFELQSPPSADVYLLAVPDDALTSVAQGLGSATAGAVLVHFAGAFGIGHVARAADTARVAALHPVQAFADRSSALRRLPGSAWGVTCSEGLEPWCARLVERDLGGRPIAVAEDDRALWHAAAVMTSNALAAVMVAGAGLLGRVGVEDPAEVLEPLVQGTAANVAAAGASAAAITGPAVRGEPRTIGRHLAALEERAPDLRPVYIHATRTIIAVARSLGCIDADVERAVLEELGTS